MTLAALRQADLLPPDQLKEAESLAATLPSGGALMEALAGRGWLTAYQADELSGGRGAGLVLGSYVLLERLGEGGMGEVFRARHKVMKREAAVKRILAKRLGASVAVERFLREVEAAALLSHPNVVQVYDAGESGGSYFLAMELLRGVDLARYLERRGPLPVAEAVEYVRQACLGLQHAHEKGLVHRDLKPANLWLTQQRQVKILDLGLALVPNANRLTRLGQSSLGSVDYVAPEQVRDPHGVDIRADVYSLGCTLYHLLAGGAPFDEAHPTVRPALHLGQEPPPLEQRRPDVPEEVAAVVQKMMAKKLERRYQTPGDAASALGALLGGGASRGWTASPPPPPPVTQVREPGDFGRETVLPTPPGSTPEEDERPRKQAIQSRKPERPAPQRRRRDEEEEDQRPRQRAAKKASGGGMAVLLIAGLAVLLLSLGSLVALVVAPKRGGVKDGGKHARDGDKDSKRDGGPKDKDNKKEKDKEKDKEPKVVPGGPLNEKQENSIGMKFAIIPKGKFIMGSPEEEKDREDNEGQHEVEITKDFYLGVHEVTQGQFREVMGFNPSYFSHDGKGDGSKYEYSQPAGGKEKVKGFTQKELDEFPVENVSWDDAQAFLKKLNARAAEKEKGRVYRLPSEAEWEYACRGGATSSTKPFHFKQSTDSLSSTQANFNGESPYGGAGKGKYLGRPCKVGSYEANRLGLYDMHGNVWEWCQDFYDQDYYASSPARDPLCLKGWGRVVRGGSWGSSGQGCRSANRHTARPSDINTALGFRVALVPVKNLPKDKDKDAKGVEGVPLDKEEKNGIGMKFVKIPRGKFMMGSTEEEREEARKAPDKKEQPDWLKAEGPRHEVEITRDFYLGAYEVTQKQYKAITGYNPSYFSKDGQESGTGKYEYAKPAGGKDTVDGKDTGDFPVELVSWEDTQEFLKKLNEREKKTLDGWEYRLPTEAEWEYSCRGGASSYKTFHYGNSLSSSQANFNGNYPYGGADKGDNLGRTCKVGTYRANAFGLYDMHGNVWEWCQDRYDPNRVYRGGSWFHSGVVCRSASRYDDAPSSRRRDVGFRVALVPSK